MSKTMSITRCSALILRICVYAALVCSYARAGAATTYAFSYRFADGVVVAGTLSGTANGNLITNVTRISAFINGAPFGRNGKLWDYGWILNAQLFSGTSGTAVASFDGTQNALLFTDYDFQYAFVLLATFVIE